MGGKVSEDVIEQIKHMRRTKSIKVVAAHFGISKMCVINHCRKPMPKVPKLCLNKDCDRAGQLLDPSEFNKNRSYADGLQRHCKRCTKSENHRRWVDSGRADIAAAVRRERAKEREQKRKPKRDPYDDLDFFCPVCGMGAETKHGKAFQSQDEADRCCGNRHEHTRPNGDNYYNDPNKYHITRGRAYLIGRG